MTERSCADATATTEAMAYGLTVGSIRRRPQLRLNADRYSGAVVGFKALGLRGRPGRVGSPVFCGPGKGVRLEVVGEEPRSTLDERALLPPSASLKPSRQAPSGRDRQRVRAGFEDAP